MFAALGTKVTVDEALKYHLRGLAVAFRFSETIKEVQRNPAGTPTVRESGKKIPADRG